MQQTSMVLHHLHIPKTGGTAVRCTLRGENRLGECSLSHSPVKWIFEDHDFRLRDLPAGEKVFFSIRDCYTRFQSVFYSRKRKGFLGKIPWSEDEKKIFTFFQTPEDLIQAVITQQGEKAEVAALAFSPQWKIGSRGLSYWLESPDYVYSRKEDLFFIFQQPNLTADFQLFLQKCGSSGSLALPDGDKRLHQNAGVHYYLSESSKEFLQQYFEDDAPLLRVCHELRAVVNVPSWI